MTLEAILRAVQENRMSPEEAGALISQLQGKDGEKGTERKRTAEGERQAYVGNIAGNLSHGVQGILRGHVGGDVEGDIAGSMTGNVGGGVQGSLSGSMTAASGVTWLARLAAG